jgi:hypothetical protein
VSRSQPLFNVAAGAVVGAALVAGGVLIAPATAAPKHLSAPPVAPAIVAPAPIQLSCPAPVVKVPTAAPAARKAIAVRTTAVPAPRVTVVNRNVTKVNVTQQVTQQATVTAPAPVIVTPAPVVVTTPPAPPVVDKPKADKPDKPKAHKSHKAHKHSKHCKHRKATKPKPCKCDRSGKRHG